MTAYKNTAGKEAVRIVQFRPYADAADVGKGEVYVGHPNTHSIIWTSQTDFTVRVHDGFTPGGHIIQGAGPSPTPHIEVQVSDTDTVDMHRAVSGVTRTISADVKLSIDAGNAISAESDGLYAPEVTVSPGNDAVDVAVAGSGPIDYEVSVLVSADEGNIIEIRSDGLFAEASGGESGPHLEEIYAAPIMELPGHADLELTKERGIYINVDEYNTLNILINGSGSMTTDFSETYIFPAEKDRPQFSVDFKSGATVDGAAGPVSVIVPSNAVLKIIRMGDDDYLTELVNPGDGLVDAPIDGTAYGRLSGAWAKVTPEAPSDNKYYTRRNAAWEEMPDYSAPKPVVVLPSGAYTLSNSHNDRIIDASAASSVTVVDQTTGGYAANFECTIVGNTSITLVFDTGVDSNGFTAKTWTVGALPDGVVLKKRSPDDWLVMGDAS